MILVRHGQSEFNVIFGATRKDPGIVDPKLTEEGRREGPNTRHRFGAVVGFPLKRLASRPSYTLYHDPGSPELTREGRT